MHGHWITKEYIYLINIGFSLYKLALLPMIYIRLLNDNGFNIQVGFGPLVAEFIKVKKYPDEKIRNIMGNIISNW